MSEIVGYLIGQVGEMSGMRVAIPAGGLTIGRDPKEADLVISHTLVSQKHAQIGTGKDGKLYLADLQSTNGTYVNGQKLGAPVPLQANDNIEFGAEGKVVFLFESAATTSVSGVLKEAFGETVAPVEWKVGDTILGIYEVTGLLGQGGFGKVYRVHHKGWNMDLAVKSPLPQLFADEEAVANFIREAETWVNLDLHPNIAQCHYVRTIGGVPRIFAEYVPGGTLHHWIAQKKLTTLEQILDVAIQFAWGLHAAHEKGLVHQDVKPLNVLMTPDGVAKVSDFGLARSKPVVQKDLDTGEGNLVTMAGNFTLAYCSPEQVEAALQRVAGVSDKACVKLNRSTDIWSWAVSVLQMFTGKIVWKHGRDAPRVLRTHRSIFGPGFIVKMPKQLAKLLESCFCPSPEDRPKHMLEIVGALIAIYQAECGEVYPRTEPKLSEHLADGLNNRAVSLMDLGRIEQAEELWRKAQQVEPDHLESVYNLGLHNWRNGQTTDTELIARLRGVGVTHEVWRQAFYEGQVLLESGNTKAAKESVEKSTEREIPASQQVGGGGQGVPKDLMWADAVVELWEHAETEEQNGRRCLRVFKGHTGEVNEVCLSADGRWVLSGGQDTVRLWESSSGRCVRVFDGHITAVASVCFTSNGLHALSLGRDGTLKYWDVLSGECLQTLSGQSKGAGRVCLSEDGKFALVGGDDRTCLWDITAGRCVRIFEEGANRAVCMSLDGQRVISRSRNNKIEMWDSFSGQRLQSFEGHTQSVFSVCLSHDGRHVLSGSMDGTIKLWEAATGRCIATLVGHLGFVFAVSMSTDGRWAVSGGSDKTMRLWDIKTGRCLRTFAGHADLVRSVFLSDDGRLAVSTSADRIRLWQVAWPNEYVAPWMMSGLAGTREQQVVQRQFNEHAQSARDALAKGDTHTAVEEIRKARALPGCEKVDTTLELWRSLYTTFPKHGFIGGWLEHTFVGHSEPINSVSISRDGRYALSGSGWVLGPNEQMIRYWDITGRRLVTAFEDELRRLVYCVCISADGRHALSGDNLGGGNRIRLWDIANGKCFRTLGGDSAGIYSLSLSTDSRYAASGCVDATLSIWDVASGRRLHTLGGHQGGTHSVCFSKDGGYVLSGGKDGALRLWDVVGGRCVQDIQVCDGDEEVVAAVYLTEDGKYAVSAGPDSCICYWDVSTGDCVHTYDEHDGAVLSVFVSTDGRYLLSGGTDGTVRLWDVATEVCLRTFEGHTSSVRSVCLSPDCRYAVSGGSDKTVRVWALDWELDLRPEADWDDGAAPYLQNFLVLHCPVAEDGLTRVGKPQWNDDDFKGLLYTLGCTGYGWLRPGGVRRKLKQMAKSFRAFTDATG